MRLSSSSFFWVIYIVTLLWGANLVSRRAPQNRAPGWRATVNLPKNHQLAAGDLMASNDFNERVGLPQIDTTIGRHLISGRNRDDLVSPNDLRASPDLATANALVFLYPLEQEFELLDAVGSCGRVVPCVGKQENRAPECHSPSLKVLAAHRGPSPEQSWLALALPGNTTNTLRLLGAERRLLLLDFSECSGTRALK